METRTAKHRDAATMSDHADVDAEQIVIALSRGGHLFGRNLIPPAEDDLRDGINLRAMGQRDPLTEWQREGFELFSNMIRALNVDFVRYVMHVEVRDESAEAAAADGDGATGTPPAEARSVLAPVAPTPSLNPKARPKLAAPRVQATDVKAAKAEARDFVAGAGSSTELPNADAPGASDIPAPAQTTVVNDEWAKTGRNDPCPCHSGRKFKHCHGK